MHGTMNIKDQILFRKFQTRKLLLLYIRSQVNV